MAFCYAATKFISMNRIGLIFLGLISTSTSVFSQTISFNIVDDFDNKPVPYATMIIFKTRKFIVADSNGLFRVPQYLVTDSLEISSTGYSNKLIYQTNYQNSNFVGLTRKNSDLRPVIIKSNYKTIQLGSFKKSSGDYFMMGGPEELGQIYENTVSNAFFKSIK